MILVNPALSQKVNPLLGATSKVYGFGSNACFKCVNVGGATPTTMVDTSGRGNHGAFSDAPTVAQTARGLWTYQFVSAQTNYVTVPDITELLGATAATWMAWVRKDAYVASQCIGSDFAAGAGNIRWYFGFENAQNRWRCLVGDGTTSAAILVDSVFTTGWHFVWSRFTGGSATGLETGCDDSVATPMSVTTVAALGSGVKNRTYLGRLDTSYSSITLGALAIFASAKTDAEILQFKNATRPLVGA